MNKIRILLAEDDPNLGTILKAYLEAKGYDVVLCVNGVEAYDAYLKNEFDFCIIDIMMPLKDGFTLIKDIRKANQQIPVLILSARGIQDDKLYGFRIGSDDYITKPFSMEELLARIKAILRRYQPPDEKTANRNVYHIGKYVFDYTRQLLSIDYTEQKLTAKEAGLLKLLCEYENDVLDRSEALKKIWQADTYFNARSMDVYITKLRKHLKHDPTVKIMNIHGIGFKLIMNL